jgi:acyl-CoA reductase-like NAD-dependent aldehyde dehydrogenase
MGYQVMNELIKVVNCETGEVIERPRTAEEQAQIDFVIAEEAARAQEAVAKAAQRQALLDKLGITEEEAKLLLS